MGIVDAILQKWDERMVRGSETFNYRVTQFLTGHGCFSEYLCKVRAENSTVYAECDAYDSVQHTLMECPAFTTQRGLLIEVLERVLSL